MSHSFDRQDRISDLIRKEMANLLEYNAGDPRFKKVTVTDIKLSPDLAHATIFFTLYDLEEKAAVQKALNNAAAFFRCRLAEKLNMRKTPQLHFNFDEMLVEGRRIDDLLKDTRADKGGK